MTWIIEIGAGDGALSRRLAPLARRLVAIEIDPDCLQRLQPGLAQFPSAEIVAADVLKLDLNTLLPINFQPSTAFDIVGNLPYNIATAIIERFLALSSPFQEWCSWCSSRWRRE